MGPNFKENDFLDLLDEFKDKYESIYKCIDKNLTSAINPKIDKPPVKLLFYLICIL